ncbi:unnamed protein product, partial [Ectocarpus sp. 8 AP-2014]
SRIVVCLTYSSIFRGRILVLGSTCRVDASICTWVDDCDVYRTRRNWPTSAGPSAQNKRFRLDPILTFLISGPALYCTIRMVGEATTIPNSPPIKYVNPA